MKFRFLPLVLFFSFLVIISFGLLRVSFADDEFSDLQKKIREYEQKIQELQNKEKTLNESIEYLNSRIYYTELKIQDAESKGHICSVPYDPMLKVQLVADIGRNDFNPIGLFQVLGSEYRMIGFIPGKDKQDWPWYNTELRKLRYNWGKFYLPHDGHAKRMESLGLSSADILRKLGWNVPSREQTTDVSIEEGIRITRMKFGQLRIDKDKCAEFIENIKRYRRNVNTKTGAETQPVHDEHSHAADMLRGFMVNVDQMSNYDDFRQSDIMPDYEEAY